MLRTFCIAAGVLLCACDAGGGMAPDQQPADDGVDAGIDAGPPVAVDAGIDAGPPDAGTCSCDLTYGCSTCPSDTICSLSNGKCTMPSYSLIHDGTVQDNVTGLVWQQQIPSSPCPSDGAGICTWADAQSYCQHLSLGNPATGWRLPTLPELYSLVEPGNSPAIDPLGFPNTPGSATCWTASGYAGSSSQEWYVQFGAGYASSNIVTDSLNVRCVR